MHDAAVSRRRPGVLVVFPFCCDRLGHGSIQRTLALARFLAEQGIDVDLLYQGNPRIPSREAEFSAFRRVLRVDAWRSPNHADIVAERARFYAGHELPPDNLLPGSALTASARELLRTTPYGAVISTYAWTAPVYEPLPRRALRIVDLQDVIWIHARRQAEITGTPGTFTVPEMTERHLWTKWDVLLAITQEDAAWITPHLQPSQRLLTVPHAASMVQGIDGDPTRFVYLGSDNAANRHAVHWLLTRVWPRVAAARPHARLRLVGFICDAVRATPLEHTPGLELGGYVDAPIRELMAGANSVAPYLFGSGLKIKIVEAASLGRAIVTTSVGSEGTGMRPGEHLLVADSVEAFIAAMLSLLDDRALQRRLMTAASGYATRTFTAAACYRPLLDLLPWS